MFLTKNVLYGSTLICAWKLRFVFSLFCSISRAYATGDLNFDGKPDLVLTAPGYGSPGSPQEGRVYIVYGRLLFKVLIFVLTYSRLSLS